MIPAAKIGQSSPLGAAVSDGGVNFSLYSRDATAVELLLFDREDDARPARVILWIHSSTARTTTGMSSFRACSRGNYMGIEFTGHSILLKDCVLTLPRSCSTRMVVRSLFLKFTLAKRRKNKVIMRRRQ